MKKRPFQRGDWFTVLIVLTVALMLWGCGPIVIPPCIKDGSCLPTPAPTPGPVTTTTTLPAPVPTPTPQPTPTPAGHGQDDREPDLRNVVLSEDGATGNAAFAGDLQSAIDASCLNSCAQGDVVGDWERLVKAVRDALRAGKNEGGRTYGAGFDWAHGNAGGLGSELSFWRGGHFEAHQIVTSARKLRRPPNSFASRADYDAAPSGPPITIEPHPPGPPDIPACSLDPKGEIRLVVPLKSGAAGARWLDVTPQYDYGRDENGKNLGPCGNPQTGEPMRWCAIGVDGGPTGPACEAALFGVPVFSSANPRDSLTLDSPFDRGDGPNRFLAQVFGSGTAHVCSSVRPAVCTDVVVP